jgi:hypothetical protein
VEVRHFAAAPPRVTVVQREDAPRRRTGRGASTLVTTPAPAPPSARRRSASKRETRRRRSPGDARTRSGATLQDSRGGTEDPLALAHRRSCPRATAALPSRTPPEARIPRHAPRSAWSATFAADGLSVLPSRSRATVSGDTAAKATLACPTIAR